MSVFILLSARGYFSLRAHSTPITITALNIIA
jgi:hypothetical protein